MIGGYPLYFVNHFQDFRECLLAISEKYADRTLFVLFDADGTRRTVTYEAFRQDVEAVAASLLSLGLGGSHVAIVGENSYPWIVSLFAVTTTGGVAVTVDTEQSDEAIVQMVRRADAKAVLCSDTFLPLFSQLSREYDGLSYVFSMDEAKGDEENPFTFDTLLRDGRLRAWMGSDIRIDPDQPAMIVFTSGTTNASKPVLLSHRNLMANACHAESMVWLGPKAFVPLPLYHTYGLTVGLLCHLSQGYTISVGGSLKTMLRDIALYEPTSIIAVPLIVEALWGMIRMELKKRGQLEQADKYLDAKKPAPKKSGADAPYWDAVTAVLGKEIERIICGGAHLNPKICDDMEMLGVQVIEGYGITECSPIIACNRNLAQCPHSAGLVLPETEVKIVDGEIWVRGVSVAKGYYRDPALTAEFFQDGWFMTGDLGSIDRNGFLSINGRKKTLIVFKNGKKVMPEEIEGYLTGIPMIQEAMVYGVPTGTSNDDVKLALMVFPNPQVSQGMDSYAVLQHLQEHVNRINRSLPSYKQIQIIKLKDAPFEKTALKKIKRHAV